jgi:hypothetical protein
MNLNQRSSGDAWDIHKCLCKELDLSEAISKRWIHGLVRAYSLGTRVQIGVLQIGTRNGQSDS